MIRIVLAAALLAATVSGVGCNTNAPPRGPEEVCARSCAARATHCSQDECRRGCNLVLDRLSEGQGDTVIACVAAVQKSCVDRTWAHCATRVGVHADGGPPAPALPNDEEPVDDGD